MASRQKAGNGADTTFHTITVRDDAVAAAFVENTVSTCDSLVVTLGNNSQLAQAYTWDFGDGTTSNSNNPIHAFTTPGTYTITLVAENANLCQPTDTFTRQVTFQSSKVAAALSAPGPGCAPFTSHFINQSTNAATYMWDFGDGSTSTEMSPIHTYTTPGEYEVKIVAVNPAACNGLDSSLATVTVNYDSVVAGFSEGTMANCDSMVVSMTNSSQHAQSYLWDFGDGTTSELVHPNHTYGIPGTYAITLIAKNPNACKPTDPMTTTVEFQPSRVAVVPAHPVPVCQGRRATLQAEATHATNVEWHLPDGTTLTGTHATAEFTEPGTYTIL
jgi:PKD repeat protein